MWIPITIAAATFQILRTARQHELRAHLPTSAAGFARYAYGAPLALAVVAVAFGPLGRDIPSITARFWPWVAIAGLSQIAATIALLAAFKRRDFAVGTVYAKTEVLIVAALGLVGLDERLRPAGWLGALLVTIGVATLAADGSLRTLLRRSGDPAALLGLAAAAGFAAAAVAIAEAADSLSGVSAFDRALLTLTVVLVFQIVVNGAWFAACDPRQLVSTARAWRPAIWVGLFSLLGSIGWAWGFTLASAAKVRILGQIELIIAFIVASVTLGERHSRSELTAGGLVLIGVVVVTVLG